MGLLTLILEIILFLIIFIIIILLIFLYVGLDINIFLNKKENDFKGHIEVKWSFIKIFSKNFPDTEENNKNSKNNKDSKNKNNKVNNKINTKDTDYESSNDEKKEKNDKKSKKDKKSKDKWNEFKTLFPLIKINFWDIVDLIKSILSSIKLKSFKTHLILGFSSPVDTATILGYIWAFSSTPNMHKSFNLSAEPVFNREAINFKSEISFKINLLKPALKIFRLLTKKNMIKLILKSRKLLKND